MSTAPMEAALDQARAAFDAGDLDRLLEGARGLGLDARDQAKLLTTLNDEIARRQNSSVEARAVLYATLLLLRNAPVRRVKALGRLATYAAKRGSAHVARDLYREIASLDPANPRWLLAALLNDLPLLAPAARAVRIAEYRQQTGNQAQADLLDAVWVTALADPDAFLAFVDAMGRSGRYPMRDQLTAIDQLLAIGLADEAVRILREWCEGGDADVPVRQALIRALRATRAPRREVLDQFRQMIVDDPDNRGLQIRAMRLESTMKMWPTVLARVQPLLEAAELEGEVVQFAVRALLSLDRPGDAAKVYAAAQDRIGPDAASQAAAARAAALLGMPETAQAVLETLGDDAGDRLLAIELIEETGDYLGVLARLEAMPDTAVTVAIQSAALRSAAARSVAEGAPGRVPDFLFARVMADPRYHGSYVPHPGHVLIASSTMVAGGAERQTALTARHIAAALAPTGGHCRVVVRDMSSSERYAVMAAGLAGSLAEVIDLNPIDDRRVFRDLFAAGDLPVPAAELIAALPSNLARAVTLLYDQFVRARPEVVHLWQDGMIAVGSLAATLAGVPRIVCSIRNVMPPPSDTRRYRPYLGPLYRALHDNPRVMLTANSAAGARDYEAALGLGEGAVAVIRNGVDLATMQRGAEGLTRAEVRERLGVPEGAVVMGGVFRLVPAKRPDRWLEIARRVADRVDNCYFAILGEGPMREELEQLAISLGLGGRIRFAGRQAPVEPWIKAMDLMLLASDLEGLPNVLIEAQTLGVPVVATDAGGCDEAVLDGVTGRVVARDDLDGAVEGCAAILGDPALRARAREEGPRFIEGRFGLVRMVGETLAAYRLAAGLSHTGSENS